MASSSNKLIPIVTLAGVAIVGAVLFVQFKGGGAVKPGADLKAVPAPTLPKTSGADHDTPDETLKTVATSNEKLRKQVEDVVAANKALMEENRKLQAAKKPEPASPLPAITPAPAPAAPAPAPASPIDLAITSVGKAADTFSQGLPGAAPRKGMGAGTGGAPASYAQASAAPGAVSYAVMAPMGYAVQTEKARGQGQGVEMTRYVRTMQGGAPLAGNAQGGPASRAAQQAKAKEPVPYFTIPENGTLAGAIGMTALIGRVPIDGRVTDPMQFKAVIGRDNLAANGFELPPDVSGIIVSGVAIGDMALSCVEGRVHSATFVFNDGTINTVSARRRGSRSVNTQGGQDDDALGFVSDEHGNPCIPGQFVTNAPRYLTDVVGLGVLGVAGQAYAEAQRTTYSGYDGSASAVTGNVGQYALGQAVSGGTNEVTKWMLQRMKNSFDAVIIPSGKPMVIHMDREMKIDKAPNARKLVHRWQANSQLTSGAHYGLE